jgi:hypothetical protein
MVVFTFEQPATDLLMECRHGRRVLNSTVVKLEVDRALSLGKVRIITSSPTPR